MERDGKTYCDTHQSVETALRCSKCEAYICPKCAVLTPVGYRCRKCGLERSATHSLSPTQLAGGCIAGFAIGFIASALMPNALSYFIIFVAAAVGGFAGQLVSRIIGRKSSPAVGAVTAFGFLAGAVAHPLQLAMQNRLTSNEVMTYIGVHPWPLIFGAIAGAVSWAQLK